MWYHKDSAEILQAKEERGRILSMDGDSSEDDCNFTTVLSTNCNKIWVAHLIRRESEGCAFLRFRRLRS